MKTKERIGTNKGRNKNLGIRWRLVVSFTLLSAYLRRNRPQ
jgi:hypothetical protein